MGKKRRTHTGMGCYRARSDVLNKMGYASYDEYLQSDTWRSIRNKVFQTKGTVCIKCKSAATEIHHSSYEGAVLRGKDLTKLHPVCNDCHQSAEYDGDKKRTLRQANISLGVTKARKTRKKQKRPASDATKFAQSCTTKLKRSNAYFVGVGCDGPASVSFFTRKNKERFAWYSLKTKRLFYLHSDTVLTLEPDQVLQKVQGYAVSMA